MTATEDVTSGEWGNVESNGQVYLVKNISESDWKTGQLIKSEEIKIPDRWQE